MSIKRFLAFFPIITACIPAITFPMKAIAQTETVSPFIPNETPVETLNRTCNNLKAKQAFTVDIDITYDNVLDSGAKVQFSAYQQIFVNRPNQLRSDFVGVDILPALKGKDS